MQIYLDNAATTRQKPPQVIDAVVRAMTTMGNAARGAHASSLQASRAIYDARCKLAALLGCPRPDHVVFTTNSTEALNIAINGILSPGDHVISTDVEIPAPRIKDYPACGGRSVHSMATRVSIAIDETRETLARFFHTIDLLTVGVGI